jgi:hypothetical protein
MREVRVHREHPVEAACDGFAETGEVGGAEAEFCGTLEELDSTIGQGHPAHFLTGAVG